jgi:glycerol kinase
MAKHASSIDQGAASARFILFDHEGGIVSPDQKAAYAAGCWKNFHELGSSWQNGLPV